MESEAIGAMPTYEYEDAKAVNYCEHCGDPIIEGYTAYRYDGMYFDSTCCVIEYLFKSGDLIRFEAEIDE